VSLLFAYNYFCSVTPAKRLSRERTLGEGQQVVWAQIFSHRHNLRNYARWLTSWEKVGMGRSRGKMGEDKMIWEKGMVWRLHAVPSDSCRRFWLLFHYSDCGALLLDCRVGTFTGRRLMLLSGFFPIFFPFRVSYGFRFHSAAWRVLKPFYFGAVLFIGLLNLRDVATRGCIDQCRRYTSS